jgi:16S rRNA (guanine966-N2)-methyltransferase
MRIIAGSRKGTRLIAPPGLVTRPTGDRVRESAFNLIGPVEDATVLDLYAGTGAMGLEALSRGAASAVFVESDREASRTISRNLDKLRLSGRVALGDAVRLIAEEARAGRKYDLVFVDPPYRTFAAQQAGLSRYLPAVLAPDGLVVVETSAKEEPELGPLVVRTSRRYGSARLTLFERP